MSSTVTITPTVTEEVQRARISSRASNDVDQVYGRQTVVVVFDSCHTGLGIKIIGGAGEDEEQDFGIFIKRIFFGGLVATDGRLQEGDQILEVNGDSLSGVTNKEAVQFLREAAASDYIKLIVTRDEKARAEFEDCLESQGESCGTSSVADQGSVCSQSSSRSPHDDRAWSPRERLSPYDHLSPVNRVSPGTSSLQGSQTGSPRHASPPMSRSATQTYQLTDAHYRTPGELSSEESDAETEATLPPAHSGVYDSACSSPTGLLPDPQPTPLPAYGAPLPKVSNTTVAALGALGLHRGPLLVPGPASVGAAPSPAATAARLIAASKTSTPHTGSAIPSLGNTSDTSSVFTHSPLPHPDVYHPTQRELSGLSPLTSPLTSPPDAQDDSFDVMMAQQNFSLDPQVKVRVEKLEVALRYLGIDPTPQQQLDLRNKVYVDKSGYVTYGDFVRSAREMFKHQLDARNLGANHPFSGGRHTPSHSPAKHKSQGGTDLDALFQERDQLRRDLERCQMALRQKERTCSMAEEELLRVRQEAQGAVQEARALRSKVHLSEQAQRAAQSMERDYEEVVRLLEAELLEVKARDSKIMDHPAVQKRLAILTCQLRKADLSKKTYEVATEKLLQFTEAVHEVLTGQGDGVGLRQDASRGETVRGARPPGYLGKHKRHTPLSLAAEAREVVKTVKSLIEVEPLPFGWDEAYTEDGVKYYINHVTQVTSWVHPLSNVEHTSSRPAPSHGRPLPPMPPLQNYDIPESRT